MASENKIQEYLDNLEQEKIMIETHFANMERILNENPKLPNELKGDVKDILTASDNLLEIVFNPYRKGVKGSFGLGLSIVKKSLNIMNYDIYIKNERKGVSFIIYKTKK